MRYGKRGDFKWDQVGFWILGLIVLAILLFFITQGYGKDEIDLETCRESYVLRANLPEVKAASITWASIKERLPLKCRNSVFDVTAEDLEEKREGKIIGDAFAQCWALVGNGDIDSYASPGYGMATTCVPCARIHFTHEAREAIRKSPSGTLDIEKLLRTTFFREVPYMNYLAAVGTEFSPFNPGSSSPMKFAGTRFEISSAYGSLLPFRHGALTKSGEPSEVEGAFGEVTLPKYFDPKSSDLITYTGVVTSSGSGSRDYVPYMFYYPSDQTDWQKQMKKTFLQWGLTGFDPSASNTICDDQEGIAV